MSGGLCYQSGLMREPGGDGPDAALRRFIRILYHGGPAGVTATVQSSPAARLPAGSRAAVLIRNHPQCSRSPPWALLQTLLRSGGMRFGREGRAVSDFKEHPFEDKMLHPAARSWSSCASSVCP